MNTSTEHLEGVLVDAIATGDDRDADDQLMHRTGEFLNMLDHVARNHPKVVTGEYLGEVISDLADIGTKYNLPEPVNPYLQ